ncbi:polyprenyl synthetase family protein [Streptomyces sp. NPDC101237]|uniref:polyprenyl synthetase family protein n=1 Tax=Streptomyces sp. NPDC101237 TaxID=3366139 RepID=UPI0038013E64
MRSTQVLGRLPAAAPRTPPDPVETRNPDAVDDSGTVDDAGTVDADVPGAVGRELRDLLTGRLADCRALDPVFADDIAERVARFTRRGGRRFRARLVWWSMRACGGEDSVQVRAALRTAAALELIQTCALVHDDLMDEASTRRGAPALHVDVTAQYTGTAPGPAAQRLGVSAALLAGDLALAWADDELGRLVLDPGLPRGTAHRLGEVWRTLRTEMVAGQYLDVQGQATSALTVGRALRAACLKSALYTVERPLELGAVLAGADPATTGTLCLAGRSAGLAFQLRDDLDDVFADPATTGKVSGGDVREGKPTYLLAVARARATTAKDRAALSVLEHAVGRADLTPRELADVRNVLEATGARDLVESKIGRLARQSLRHLAEATLEPRPADRLRALLAEITGTGTPRPGPPPDGPLSGPSPATAAGSEAAK